MVRVAYLTSHLAHELLHHRRAVDSHEFPRCRADIFEVPAAYLVCDENLSYSSEKWSICVMCRWTNRVSLGPMDVLRWEDEKERAFSDG
jgi:hypothetical protein